MHISKYTDGDETRHSLSQYNNLLSKLDLSYLVSKFQYEVIQGNWYKAEDSFHKILSNLPDLTSYYLESLSRTGLSNDDLYALEDNINSARAKKLIDIALDHNGLPQLTQYIKENKNSTKDDQSMIINYEDYPLQKFDDFLEFIKPDYKSRDYLLSWFEYWKSKAKKSDIIKYIWSNLKIGIYYIKTKVYYLTLFMRLQEVLKVKILHLIFSLKPNRRKVDGFIIMNLQNNVLSV